MGDMCNFQPKKRVFCGSVILDSQPRSWIRKHKSFASYEWLDTQVRYGLWIPRGIPRHFIITSFVNEGIRYLTVEIQIEKIQRDVLVRHVTYYERKDSISS